MEKPMRALLILALLSAPAMAQTPQAAGAKAEADAKTMICRREGTTGSRLPGTRVCKPREEWAREEREAQRALSTSTDRASTGT